MRSLMKGLIHHNNSNADEIINDRELAQRRAEEAGQRRHQAAQWLRQMDRGVSEKLPEEPTEEEFRLSLRNGLVLCNVLNKVNPGSVPKVVENPVQLDAAQSAIQYFENMRNFLVAVGKMKLLAFEASDLEKGGSSGKVVECILCLKGYFEWKQSGELGVWRYGGTVRITSTAKESTDEEYSSDLSTRFRELCVCGGKNISSPGALDLLAIQHKQIEGLKSLLNETKEEVERSRMGWKNEVRSIGQHVKGLEAAASSYHEVLEENRRLYNQVQDLKGSIRVFCRVRPFLSGQPNEQSTVDHVGDNGKITIANPLKMQGKRVFSFDKVFGTNVTQQDIYDEAKQLIRSVLDGYNVCIFAYGQTGSGKTYTMSGPDSTNEETWGVNYRALHDLFRISEARAGIVEYEVGVQMIEIYNEQVRDLLVSDKNSRRLDIRNNSQLNGLNVPDASLVPVKSSRDVLDSMRVGQRNRAVGSTALNVRSSRSHSILTVHVRGKEVVSGSVLNGCLHLVDLAGSERLDKSEAVGERLKEAQHINKSLSALGDVVAALAQKSSHVPYRNSKLTQVLQDSLGGHAKTLMFVHVSPDVEAFGETISTLKFAERVGTIDLGAARSNKESSEIREFKDEISSLKLMLERKESELELVKSRANLTDERRSRIPSKFTDNKNEQRSSSSVKSRYSSPPIRRSISTDRGASVVKTRIKPDALEKSPVVVKAPFPTSLPVHKSVPSVVSLITRLDLGSKEAPFPSTLDSLNQQGIVRKVKHGIEEDQMKQALNVRQGGIRKVKPEGKVRIKQKFGVVSSGKMMEKTQKIDLSDTENARVKKLHHRIIPMDSQNVELSFTGHLTTVPEFRRSVSTTQGKYLI